MLMRSCVVLLLASCTSNPGTDPGWTGKWSVSGTAMSACGTAPALPLMFTTTVDGDSLQSQNFDFWPSHPYAPYCALVWDVAGTTATLASEQGCTFGPPSSDLLIWSTGTLSLDGDRVTWDTSGTGEGCARTEDLTLVRVGSSTP